MIGDTKVVPFVEKLVTLRPLKCWIMTLFATHLQKNASLNNGEGKK